MPVLQPSSGLTQAYGAQGRLNGSERATLQEQIKTAREEKLEAAEKSETGTTEGGIRSGETVNALSAGVTDTTRLAQADPNSPRGSYLDIVI